MSEPFRAVEVEGTEREEIVAAYRRKLGRSVQGYFARIPNAEGHPVFRMTPIDSRADPGTVSRP